MKKNNKKKYLLLTIIVAIAFLILLWFLGDNIFPNLREEQSLFGLIIVSAIAALIIVGLIACYQFFKEYVITIYKNKK